MIKEIVLAGGCFWGVEEYYQRIPGIKNTEVAYVNGTLDSPTYEQICSGRTGAAEGVKIQYEDTEISLEEILSHFYSIIDPFSLNRQGMDIGNQYRTGLYYMDENTKDVFLQDRKTRQKNSSKPIQVEIKKLENYYPAEDYHQRYLQKNPGGYCHIILPEK